MTRISNATQNRAQFVSVRLRPAMRQRLVKMAAENNRSLSNQAETLLSEALERLDAKSKPNGHAKTVEAGASR